VNRRPSVAFLVALLAMAVTGTATAYWAAGGSGAGNATAGTAVAVTVSPGTAVADVYPGGQTDVVLTVMNTNFSSVRIGSLALDVAQGTGGFAVDAPHSGCDLSALTYTTQTNGGAGWTVPAKVGVVNGTLSVTLTDALAMDADAVDACQGADFSVYLAAGA
jgi:hypothetical protein